MRWLVTLSAVVVAACGGRTDLGGSTPAALADAGAEAAPAPSSQYKVAYQAETVQNAPVLVWHSRDGSIEPFGFPQLGTFTYDGKLMVYADFDTIYVLDEHGQTVRTQQNPSPWCIVRPRPDGQRLLLGMPMADSTSWVVATLDPDGTHNEIASGTYAEATYTSDGTAVDLFDTQTGTITTMHDDGSGQTIVPITVRLSQPALSYDGKHVVYVQDATTASAPPGIGVLDLDSQVTSVTLLARPIEAAFHPSFTPNGAGIVFVVWRGNDASLMHLDLATQEVTALIDVLGSQYNTDFAISVAAD